MKLANMRRLKQWGVWLVCMILMLLGMTVAGYAEPAGNLAVSLNASQTTCTVTLSDYQMPAGGAVLSAAVWSETGGQDDLIWRDMKKSGSGYSVSFPVSEHKSSGRYAVHLYLRTKAGKMVFVTHDYVTVAKASMTGIAVKNLNQQAGTCKVELTGVTAPSGITQVQVPIWSKSDQSDIVWYKAVNQGNGTWTVDVSFAKHKSHTGTYQIHVYATTGNGFRDFLGNTKTVYDPSQKTEPDTPSAVPAVTASLNGDRCSLKATGVNVTGGVKTFYFAVWSDTDGQDDLIWNTASFNSTAGTAEKTIDLADYCDYGKYLVHAYAQDNSGKMVFVAKTEFDLPYPSVDSVETKVNGTAFTVTIKGVHCVGGIDKISVPIWSKSDQSDIVWYKAVKNSDGNYVVSSDSSKHQNSTGNYTVHVYVYDGRDSYGHLVKNTGFSMGNSAGNLSVTRSTDGSVYTAKIDAVSVAGGHKKLLAAVWSQKNSQDDLYWYTCSESGSSCTAQIQFSRHKDEGLYYLHLYAEKDDGSMSFVKKFEFEVKGAPAEAVNILIFENNTGSKVDVKVRLASNVNATGLLFPAWCAADQSDIIWYNAVKQSDGYYKTTIDVVKHANHSGVYKVHAYYKDTKGALQFVGGSTVELKAAATNVPEVQGNASITSCRITDGKNVTVQAAVTGSGTFGLFALKGGETGLGSGQALATTTGSGTITLTAPAGVNTAQSLINKKLVVGQKQGTGYVPVSTGCYITNPEAVASDTHAFPTVSTKKGLSVVPGMEADAKALGVKHSVLNVVLNNIPCASGGFSYEHNGKTWHMDMGYITALDNLFAAQASNGSIVSVVLLMQWNDQWKDLIIESGRTPGHAFYGLNAETEAAREQLEAIFCYLAERYSGPQYNVVNWILGNEVDDFTNWNWCGSLGMQEYTDYYGHAFRLLYNSVKSCYSNARVYVSMDHVWNYPRQYGFKGSEFFRTFVEGLKAEGEINWNIAFHPYPNPLTSANFWSNRAGVTNSSSSGFFTMINLQYLTDYIKNTYGAQHRFILSETGFTSVENGKTDEKLQAAAIAYGYYLAAANDMVDSFVVHGQTDNAAEKAQGLYLGLWKTDSAKGDEPTDPKIAWTVFQKMDTAESAAYTNFALSIIGADRWESIVPGYTPQMVAGN